jgi:hypothetical protein
MKQLLHTSAPDALGAIPTLGCNAQKLKDIAKHFPETLLHECNRLAKTQLLPQLHGFHL